MTARQAGLLIRILKDKPVKTFWQIDLPARAFLGIDQDVFNKTLVAGAPGTGLPMLKIREELRLRFACMVKDSE